MNAWCDLMNRLIDALCCPIPGENTSVNAKHVGENMIYRINMKKIDGFKGQKNQKVRKFGIFIRKPRV